jgi:phosphohistidine phosphatase
MIQLYLVRHGIATDKETESSPDHARPLTAEGRQRFRKAAKAFARLGEKLDHLFTSPLVRAVQTAELLASALGHDEVGVLLQLEPGAPAAELFAELGKRVKDGQSVAIVGHDPQISQAVVLAAGLSPHEAMQLDFRKGAIVRIDVKGLPKTLPATPRWWMKPKRRELVKGLPIDEPKGAKKSNGKDDHKDKEKDKGPGETQ